MMKISKSREKYLLEKYFGTKNKKNIPLHLSQFGCRDSDVADEDVFFITQYVTSIGHLAIGGTFVTAAGLECLKKLKEVEYLDLRSMPLRDDNLDCILHLKTLEYLYIKFTEVTTEGVFKILASLPLLQTLIAEIPEKDGHLEEDWKKQFPKVELVLSLRRER